MHLIGLNGFKESGKDTTGLAMARYLHARGVFAERRGFADKMKIAGMRAFVGGKKTDEELIGLANELKEHGSVTAQIRGNRQIDIGVTGRQFWQYLGTESLRGTYGKDFHVDALLPRDLQAHEDDWAFNFWTEGFPIPQVCIITDVRFVNEAERVRDLGGEIWNILRPHHCDAASTHASEVPLPAELVDRVLFNDKGLSELINNTIPTEMQRYIRQNKVKITTTALSFDLPSR